MTESLNRVRTIVDIIVNGMAIVVFIIIFAVVLLQVFMRFFVGSPLVWSEELARYLFVWISFIGWVLATKNKTHIRISAFTNNLPKKVKNIIGTINFILIAVFSIILGYFGYIMTIKNLDVPTVTLFFSYAFVYAAVPFSSILILSYSILNLASDKEAKGSDIS